MKTLLFVLIFFSGFSIFSMNSTENRQELDLQQRIEFLQESLVNLWGEGCRGSKESYDAYTAFLDVCDHNFPVVSEPIMDKLCKANLAIKIAGTGEIMFDASYVSLWNQYGRLSDGMCPVIQLYERNR